MPLIDLSNPFNVLIALILFVLTLILAKETKRSTLMCIMLLVFLTIIVGHTIEYILMPDIPQEISKILINSITTDYIFVFLSYISYLWLDNIECVDKKEKSIDDSLRWFWKKV